MAPKFCKVLTTTAIVTALLVLASSAPAAQAALIPETNTLANSARNAAMRQTAASSSASSGHGNAASSHKNVMMLTSSSASDENKKHDNAAAAVGRFNPYVALNGQSDDAMGLHLDSSLLLALSRAPSAVLRKFLSDRSVTCAGCIDRDSLVEAAVRARHLPSLDDATAAALSLGEDWAVTRLALRALEADGVTSTDSLFEAEVAGAYFTGVPHPRGAADYGMTSLPVGAVAGGGDAVTRGPSLMGALSSFFSSASSPSNVDSESRNSDPRSRESVVRPLSDDEVASLVQIMDLRNQVDLGRMRCVASGTNSTQVCSPVAATVSRMVTPSQQM